MKERQFASKEGSPNAGPPRGVPQAGPRGEHILQQQYGTTERASQFYDNQVSDKLTPKMIEFIGRMEMAFIATSDAAGDCDCSFRAGEAGFLRVLDERTIAYPDFRGNGVMASLGNMLENPHVGILMIDFTRDLIGLHVNGAVEIVTASYLQELDQGLPEPAANLARRPVQWVLMRVSEAFIHCSKHIPKLIPQSRVRHWGTDNPRHKGGDYFGVAARNLARQEATSVPAASVAGGHPPVISPEHHEPLVRERYEAGRRQQANLPAESRAGTFML
jgi:uncharacterized protein